MKIAFLPGELTCTGKYYGSLPAASLREAGHNAICDLSGPPDVTLRRGLRGQKPRDHRYRNCDIVVLIRPAELGLGEFVRTLRAAGTIVVNCIDDWLAGEGQRLTYYGGADGVSEVLATYRDCDAFVVSTPRLAENLASYDKPTWVQPIALWQDHWRGVMPRPEDATVRVGWSGVGSMRPYDLLPLADVIHELLNCLPQLRFFAIGDPGTLEVLGIANHPHATACGLVPLEELPARLAQIDIGLAPLARSEVNACKTGIKVIEYMAAGAVPIAAAHQPEYSRIVGDAGVGELADEPCEWADAIRRLASDPALLRQQRQHAKEASATHFAEVDPGQFDRLFREIHDQLR